MDTFLLEQFLIDLEENTQRWVHWHLPKTSQEALQLAEDYNCAQSELPWDWVGTYGNTKLNEMQGDWESRAPA